MSDPTSLNFGSVFVWFIYLVIGAGFLIGVLIYALRSNHPEEFSKLPVLQFFAISAIVVSFILSISYIPPEIVGDIETFPISTEKFTIDNSTQWMLNIGGIKSDDSKIGGLQIPIYIIVAGILGAYIRYLYMGIREFREEFFDKISEFELLRSNLRIVENDLQKMEYDQNLHTMSTEMRLIYQKDKAQLEEALLNAEKEYKNAQFKLRMEEVHNTLEALGFVFLAPLLAVSAWLLLTIGGTNNHYTFALVSFSVGLTTEKIINSIKLFVGDKLANKQDDYSQIKKIDEKDNDEKQDTKLKDKKSTVKETEPKLCIITAAHPDDKEKIGLSFFLDKPSKREPEVKWDKSVVTYALIKGTQDIRENSDVTEKTAMNLAMLTWGLEIPIKLKLVKKDENPDITVVFNHTDEDEYLKDHKRILGYAYPPKHPYEGTLVINDDYLWSVTGDPIEAWKVDPIHYSPENSTTFKTYNLTSTLIHELGHTLGMPHIDDCPECIMHTHDNENLDLHEKDIGTIQRKYGKTERSEREYQRLKEWLNKRVRREHNHD